jgi:hypothetical protein
VVSFQNPTIDQEFTMSEASRAAALAHAAAVHHGSGDAVATLESAEAFHSFIVGSQEETAAPTKPAKAAAKAPAKPAKPVEEDAPDETEVTKEQVGEAIEALLNANLRPKALGLFKKYGATSLSSLSADNYAAVKQEAEDILMSA